MKKLKNRMDYLLKVFFGLLMIVSLGFEKTSAQGASNKGTDFWLVYAPHINGYSDMKQRMSIYITSEVSTTGKIEIPGINYTTDFTVEANKVTIVDVPQTAYAGGTEGKVNKGIHLSSLKPIVAYGHIYNSSMSGATLLLPTNTLGKEYYSINFTQKANSGNAYSFCSVVATEDNTQVVITPTVNTQGGLIAGVPKTIILNKGEVYQVFGKKTSDILDSKNNLIGTVGDDLTGTTIKSIAANGQTCKRIAVFSGSSRISIGCPSSSGAPGSADNLFQQVYPTSTWGKSFITVPSKDRNYDVYRIFKSTPNTVVRLNGNVISASSFVNGLYYEFDSKTVNYIEADNAIQAVQYQVTQGKGINCTSASGDVGDPEMIFLNPLEQTLDKMTMYSSPFYAIQKHFINVVIRTSDVASFTLDGVSKASSFLPVANKTGYSYAQISVTEGTHNLQADGGFNAIAYGFGNAESYGYAAGASLISPGVEAVDPISNKKKETGCIGEAYNLFVSLPYQPLSLKADFDDGQGSVAIPIVLVDTYTLNSITYYKYKLIANKIYTVPRKYIMKIVAEKPLNDGCGAVDELNFEYEVLELPGPGFEVLKDKVCKGQAISFSDKSQGKGNSIVKWYWDYGDGNKVIKSDAKTYDYTYQNPGIYTVKLMVENQAGCLSTEFSKKVQVLNDPSVQFKTTTSLCETKEIKFEDMSSSVDEQITSWSWDFGDGKTAAIQNPTHIFSTAGNYQVKLTVGTTNSCSFSVTKTIKINPLPNVDFELSDFCLNDSKAVFKNKTTLAGSETISYLWDFGDQNANAQRPNTSTAFDGEHVYTQAGLYEISLTAKTQSGCEVIVKKQFRVNGSIPKANFEVLNEPKLCSEVAVQFKDLSTVDFGEITRIEWFFDYIHKSTPDLVDENPSLRTSVPKIYSFNFATFTDELFRKFTVKMKVFSGGSCVSEMIKEITIYPMPKVNFDLQSSCLQNGIASFINKSTYIDPSKTITYLWDFGDKNANTQHPNTSTAKDASHFYSEAGKYKVSLTAKTEFSCEVLFSKEITISAAIPQAGFDVENTNSLCVANAIVFKENSTIAFGEITRVDWYYDFLNNPLQIETDNAPGTRNNPKTYTHQYPIFNFPFTKDIVVKMVTYSGEDCIASIEKTITLKAIPSIIFESVGEYCLYAPPIQLIAKELNNMPGNGVFSGTGVNSTGLFNPAKAGVGTHTITYKFDVANGCTIEKTQIITVNEVPVVDAGPDLIILEGGMGIIKASAFGEGLTYKWTPSTALDRDDVLQPTIRPVDDLQYTLTVTSNKGCISKASVKIKVLHELVVPNTFTPNNDGINDNWTIKYMESYPSAKIEVFDRSGQKVFYSIGYAKPFDGTFNGKPLPIGTYFYIISLHTKKKPLTGALTIIR